MHSPQGTCYCNLYPCNGSSTKWQPPKQCSATSLC